MKEKKARVEDALHATADTPPYPTLSAAATKRRIRSSKKTDKERKRC